MGTAEFFCHVLAVEINVCEASSASDCSLGNGLENKHKGTLRVHFKAQLTRWLTDFVRKDVRFIITQPTHFLVSCLDVLHCSSS